MTLSKKNRHLVLACLAAISIAFFFRFQGQEKLTLDNFNQAGWNCTLKIKHVGDKLFYVFSAKDEETKSLLDSAAQYQNSTEYKRLIDSEFQKPPVKTQLAPVERLALALRRRERKLSNVSIRFYDPQGFNVDEINIPMCSSSDTIDLEKLALHLPLAYEASGSMQRQKLCPGIKSWKAVGLPNCFSEFPWTTD
jgi:hypothetical protein